MARKRKLTKDDLEDVSIYEDVTPTKKQTTDNTIKLNDLSIKVKCLNEKQKDLKNSIEKNEITIVVGDAGCGKTYVSLMTALHLLKTNPIYKKVVLIKSLQVIKGEEIGFLPGTVNEKILPYMNSYVSNLDKIFGSHNITKAMIDNGTIEIYPIAYVRGVTFSDSIIICDEMQNITMDMFKTLITRIGENSKYVFSGDLNQIDRTNKKESCLSKIIELFKTEEYVGILIFNEEDCVRNPLIPKILKILNNK